MTEITTEAGKAWYAILDRAGYDADTARKHVAAIEAEARCAEEDHAIISVEGYRDGVRAERARLAKIDRLRAALEIIAAQPESAPDAIPVKPRNIARAALRSRPMSEPTTEVGERLHCDGCNVPNLCDGIAIAAIEAEARKQGMGDRPDFIEWVQKVERARLAEEVRGLRIEGNLDFGADFHTGHRTGWNEAVDRVLAVLLEDDRVDDR